MNRPSGRAWFGLWVIAAGCDAPSVNQIEVCTLDLVLTPTSAAPGDVVTATGGPLTEAGPRDHVVQVGGVSADVRDVTRSEACTSPIDGCDLCRAEASCPPCGFCPLDVGAAQAMGPDRLAQCFGDPLADPVVQGSCDLCEQTLTFVVPEGLPPGPTSVIVFNGDGQSPTLTLEVLAATTPTSPPATTP